MNTYEHWVSAENRKAPVRKFEPGEIYLDTHGLQRLIIITKIENRDKFQNVHYVPSQIYLMTTHFHNGSDMSKELIRVQPEELTEHLLTCEVDEESGPEFFALLRQLESQQPK